METSMKNVNALSNIAQNTKILTILHHIIDICSYDDNIQRVILHGSWAKGTALNQSDIDIALEGENINFDNILDTIEEIDTLYTVDLVHLDKCKNQLLREEIEKYGITIYSKV
jgi:predicted nucleotidyltransferase